MERCKTAASARPTSAESKRVSGMCVVSRPMPKMSSVVKRPSGSTIEERIKCLLVPRAVKLPDVSVAMLGYAHAFQLSSWRFGAAGWWRQPVASNLGRLCGHLDRPLLVACFVRVRTC